MKYTFPCNIAPDEEGSWGFVVSFPDVKGAHTSGRTFKEAIILAEDCMVVALSCYVDSGEDLPIPSSYQKGQELLTVQPVIAAQLDLYTAMREQNITLTQLAQRLGIGEQDAAPLLRLDYCTPLGRVMQALEAVGRSPAMAEQAA